MDVDERCLSLFIQVAGRGTRKLAGLTPGDRVTVWGPLGTSFAVKPDTPTLLLAGGVGLIPFVGYARHHPNPKNLRLVFGHRPPAETFPLDAFDGIGGVEMLREESPEDIPRFIDLLGRQMREYAREGLILACGPTPFLRTVRTLAISLKAGAWLSLENSMGCGMGACLGCTVEKADGSMVRACTEGPVFAAESIRLPGDKS